MFEGWLYTKTRNLINSLYRSMYIKKRHEVFIDDNISNIILSSDNDFEKILNGNIDDIEMLSDKILKKQQIVKINHMSILELSGKYDVSAIAITTRICRLKKKIKNIIHDPFIEMNAKISRCKAKEK
ncbi:RNA polymerase, sigma-24 subunit, ECF subfamily [Desulfofarcimen acetoxidans DSM 771]|uniref:RNA polymerase, sigma-24 subunit, ECF subfamily n=2 Tax=Desulfofarcimen acetoxidans TaxID=58138 RepID=C8W299_DESAS|nr:RNA polymerase, sigma-24 subunit, ECF subfamily [Desulfofarcimen acetoxidans DSM 771]